MRDMIKKVVAGPYELIWQEFKQLMEYSVVTPICQGTMPEMRRMQDLFSRFGTWETLCNEMDTMLTDEAYYKDQYDEIGPEYEENKIKLDELRDDIAEIRSELEGLQENIEPDDAKERYEELLDKLDDIAEGNRPRYKRKKRK